VAQIEYRELEFAIDGAGEKVELGDGGGSSTVFAAVYQHQRVAVKQLRTVTPAFLAALQREAVLQSSISHENIVRVLGLASDVTTNAARPRHALIMARLWRSLGALLAEAEGEGGGAAAGQARALKALPPAWRLHALHQCTAGLAHLHARRVAHGDLKPANILLTHPSGPRGGVTLQLTDFGFSRVSGGGGGGPPHRTQGGARGGGGGTQSM
jgi:serine/threonine protein kinase